MFASIRHTTVTSVDEAKRLVKEDYLPNILSKEPGFIGLYFVKVSEGEIISLALFETKQQAENSTTPLRDWVRRRAADLAVSGPEITIGEVVISQVARPQEFPGEMAA